MKRLLTTVAVAGVLAYPAYSGGLSQPVMEKTVRPAAAPVNHEGCRMKPIPGTNVWQKADPDCDGPGHNGGDSGFTFPVNPDDPDDDQDDDHGNDDGDDPNDDKPGDDKPGDDYPDDKPDEKPDDKPDNGHDDDHGGCGCGGGHGKDKPGNDKPEKSGQNPGNDKAVGNSPFDGERGEEPSGKDKDKGGKKDR